MTDVVIPISRQGMAATIPTTPATVALPLSLYSLTSFTVVYRLTVKWVWERLTSVTIGCLLLQLQDLQQCHRSDPHDLNRARRPSTGATILSVMSQGRDGQASIGSGLWLHHSRRRSPVTHVKTLCPLETIKGEPGHTSKIQDSRHTHTTLELQASSRTHQSSK